MRIGIDASNIRAGGGVTHLTELLRAAQPEEHDIQHIAVWGGQQTLDKLPQRPWLSLFHEPMLNGSSLHRVFWRRTKLTSRLIEHHCDLLFVPGGMYTGNFKPFVTIAHNMLPFEPDERRRFGLSWTRLKLHLLEFSQTATFRRADGVKFASETSRQVVEDCTGPLPGRIAIIPGGISDGFRCPPRQQKPLSMYSWSRPFRWLYVSIVAVYKHQWHVVEAVAKLRKEGVPVTLDLIGFAYPPALRRLQKVIRRVDPGEEFIHYRGYEPYTELANRYHQADGSIFASSCETLSYILLEAMASGLPIACSNRSDMPETLRDAGVYFDPECPTEIARALSTLLNDVDLRSHLAQLAYERAQQYSWERCAQETFSFLVEVAQSTSAKGGA
jgi:glycosyltransferase involved in cell wall biosynthesis